MGGASQAEDVRGLRGDQSERSIRSPLESLDQTSEHPRDVGHHGPAGGVKWIWEEARLNLADSMGVLDIDHALEAVGDTSKNLFGDGTPEANAWTNLLRTTILERGWEVFDGFWQQTRSPFSETSPASDGSERITELPRQPGVSDELRRTAKRCPFDRERPNRRGLEKPDSPPPQPHGRTL